MQKLRKCIRTNILTFKNIHTLNLSLFKHQFANKMTHLYNLKHQLQCFSHKHTHTRVCLKGFLWLDLRHGATTQAWNHLCRHTSINQHRKDVWHHETTRFTTQAESSKCFHTELCYSALLRVFFTCLSTLLVVWRYLYFMYGMRVKCMVVFRFNIIILSLCLVSSLCGFCV